MDVEYAMCIHYPKHSGHYDLCFCDLKRYKQKDFLIDQLESKDVLEDIHVLLPVFIDSLTNEYAKPKDLIQIKAPVQKRYHPMAEEEYKERDRLKQKELNDAFAMLNVKPAIDPKPIDSHRHQSYYSESHNQQNYYNEPHKPQNYYSEPHIHQNYYNEPHKISPSPSMTGKRQVKANNTESTNLPAKNLSASNKSVSTKQLNSTRNVMQNYTKETSKNEAIDEEPLSVYEYEVLIPPENNEENFPTLSPSTTPRSVTPINGRQPKGLFKPTLGTDKPKQNRVLRIVPQKSSSPRSPMVSLSLVDR